ncbi:GATA transcription factor 12-like isoform X1 [Musa acuminata AAA Group]|uniref:GATA transcription factor 12-like isoform X1 n=1 Tax=Musa acuminata AAA Group TaxID=214697 RepID=UPI0031D7C842
METPEYFHGGFYRGGNPQCGPEKKAGGCGGGGEDQFSLEDLLDFSNEEEDETGGTLAAAGNSTDSSTVTAVDSCSNSFSGLEPHFSNDLVGRSLADASRSGDLCEPEEGRKRDETSSQYISSYTREHKSVPEMENCVEARGLSKESIFNVFVGHFWMQQYEELAELEWLSNFVEESFSSEDLHKLHPISGVSSTTTGSSSTTTAAAAARTEVSAHTQVAAGGRVNHVAPFRPEAIVPGKARSKRSRAAPCSWSSRLLVLSPSLATASSPESELIVPASAAAASAGGGGKKAVKPASKKKDLTAGTAVAAGNGRKCLHCQTDKTPQWRTGPLGPKTLCNACGVRYKSGRLVPEYRPAASPTFVVSKHSNSHRKVLELRRQKELQQQQLFHAGGVASFYDGPMPVAAAAADDDDFLIHGPDFRHLI